MSIAIGILEQGLILAIAALGVYITYSILDFPDLSVDGTFALGGATAAIIITNGGSLILAIMAAMVAGALGGLVTGVLNVHLKITNLLSGILVMIGLYSINLRVMGKANLPLLNKATLFTLGFNKLVTIFFIVILLKIALDLIFKTKFGFILKVTGDNEVLVTSLGVNKGRIKIIALVISNSLVALSGALMAQYQGFSDITMGTGLIIVALAAIIIGQSLFRKEGFIKATTIVIIGAILYKLIITLVLSLGVKPTDVKLITALIVVIFISIKNVSVFSFIRKNLRKADGTSAKAM